MSRLEEIKKVVRIQEDSETQALWFFSPKDVRWLISEVEQLEKDRRKLTDIIIKHGLKDVKERFDLTILRVALERIDDEPNQIGPTADELVDQYDIQAWAIAHKALTQIKELVNASN